jgi:hypothetical protein
MPPARTLIPDDTQPDQETRTAKSDIEQKLDGLPAEYRDFPALSDLQAPQKVGLRALLRNLYATRCAALDKSLASADSGDIDQEVSRARALHKVEVSLAAIDALEKGLYVTIDPEGPVPDLTPNVERIITGIAGLVDGKRANVVVVMPHDRYPNLRATRDYKSDVTAEQRRARIIAFNQLPVDQRRALRAKSRDHANLSHADLMSVHGTFPPGTDWDEASATVSDRAWRR